MIDDMRRWVVIEAEERNSSSEAARLRALIASVVTNQGGGLLKVENVVLNGCARDTFVIKLKGVSSSKITKLFGPVGCKRRFFAGVNNDMKLFPWDGGTPLKWSPKEALLSGFEMVRAQKAAELFFWDRQSPSWITARWEEISAEADSMMEGVEACVASRAETAGLCRAWREQLHFILGKTQSLACLRDYKSTNCFKCFGSTSLDDFITDSVADVKARAEIRAKIDERMGSALATAQLDFDRLMHLYPQGHDEVARDFLLARIDAYLMWREYDQDLAIMKSLDRRRRRTRH